MKTTWVRRAGCNSLPLRPKLFLNGGPLRREGGRKPADDADDHAQQDGATRVRSGDGAQAFALAP